VLVEAIDQLIGDDDLLGRFSERTGFGLETTYAARRYLSRIDQPVQSTSHYPSADFEQPLP
jgi:hypothetical protein